MLSQNSTSLTVAENQLATSIGLAAPVDSVYSAADLTVIVTGLPSNGTILLADGITPVNLGQSLTVTQLVGLKFRPALNSFATSSSFGFTVSDPAGSSAIGSAVLTIGAATTPVLTSWTSLTVPQNAGSTSIGIAAPTDANFSSSSLSAKITALPTNGTVFLSDGKTAVTVGQTLTVAQLTGLLFKSAANGSRVEISSLNYSVSDPAGKSSSRYRVAGRRSEYASGSGPDAADCRGQQRGHSNRYHGTDRCQFPFFRSERERNGVALRWKSGSGRWDNPGKPRSKLDGDPTSWSRIRADGRGLRPNFEFQI